jgi:peptide deformylase
MTKLNVLKYPDPKLFERSSPVEIVDGVVPMNIVQLVDDMLETMYEEGGVGLSAPQVGVLKHVIVVDVSKNLDEKGERIRVPLAFINPVVVERSKKTVDALEGCLSIPGYYDYVTRPQYVRIKAYSKDGKPAEVEATDLLSVALQHEIEHLCGVLFIQRLSKLKRDLLNAKIKKAGGHAIPLSRL